MKCNLNSWKLQRSNCTSEQHRTGRNVTYCHMGLPSVTAGGALLQFAVFIKRRQTAEQSIYTKLFNKLALCFETATTTNSHWTLCPASLIQYRYQALTRHLLNPNLKRCHYTNLNVTKRLIRSVRIAGRQGFHSSQGYSIETGSGALPALYTIGTGGSFPGNNAAGACSWSPAFIKCRGQEWWSYTSTPPFVFMAYCLIK
jgi:hypothetical protein